MNDLIVNQRDGSTILRANTWLYLKTIKNEGTLEEKVHYRPYMLEDWEYLKTLKLGLFGDAASRDTRVWNSTFIRFGWLDKELSSLEWVSFAEVIEDHRKGIISKTNRNKLNHVCRLLFMSIREINHV